jgi:hypothetical protein
MPAAAKTPKEKKYKVPQGNPKAVRRSIANDIAMATRLNDELEEKFNTSIYNFTAETFPAWLALNKDRLSLSPTDALNGFLFTTTGTKARSRDYLLRKLSDEKGAPSRQTIPDMARFWKTELPVDDEHPVATAPLNSYKIIDGEAKLFDGKAFLKCYPVNRSKNRGREPLTKYLIGELYPFFLHPNLDAKSAEWQSSLAQALANRKIGITQWSQTALEGFSTTMFASDSLFIKYTEQIRKTARDRRGHDSHSTTVKDEIRRKCINAVNERVSAKRREAYQSRRSREGARYLRRADAGSDDDTDSSSDEEEVHFNEYEVYKSELAKEADWIPEDIEEKEEVPAVPDDSSDDEAEPRHYTTEWTLNLLDANFQAISTFTFSENYHLSVETFECPFNMTSEEVPLNTCGLTAECVLYRTIKNTREEIHTHTQSHNLSEYADDQTTISGTLEFVFTDETKTPVVAEPYPDHLTAEWTLQLLDATQQPISTFTFSENYELDVERFECNFNLPFNGIDPRTCSLSTEYTLYRTIDNERETIRTRKDALPLTDYPADMTTLEGTSEFNQTEECYTAEWTVDLTDADEQVISTFTYSENYEASVKKFECAFKLSFNGVEPQTCRLNSYATVYRTIGDEREQIRTQNQSTPLTDYPSHMTTIEGSLEFGL